MKPKIVTALKSANARSSEKGTERTTALAITATGTRTSKGPKSKRLGARRRLAAQKTRTAMTSSSLQNNRKFV